MNEMMAALELIENDPEWLKRRLELKQGEIDEWQRAYEELAVENNRFYVAQEVGVTDVVDVLRKRVVCPDYRKTKKSCGDQCDCVEIERAAVEIEKLRAVLRECTTKWDVVEQERATLGEKE